MIRILIFINALTPGGAERQVIQDANLLMEGGYQVTVCFGKAGSLKQQLADRINVIDLSTRSQLKACKKLYIHLKNEKYDLIFSHMFWANKTAAMAAALTGQKLVQFEHGLGLWRKWYHLILFRLAAKKASAVITCSHTNRELKIQREGLPEKKVTVVPNSFQPHNIDDCTPDLSLRFPTEKKFTIAFCGRFNAVKQLHILVEMAVIMKEKGHHDFCFILIGDGEQREAIEQLVEENDLQPYFFMTGYVQNPYQFLNLANCFVLPSKREDFSLALLEASYCKLPCIAFDVGGNSEIIDDGISGYVIPPYDVPAMASKIQLLMKNPAVAGDMGERAKQKVVTEYSGAKRLQALNDLIASHKK
jgi:glycosyltransferase involved in cell wall biosynthesis